VSLPPNRSLQLEHLLHGGDYNTANAARVAIVFDRECWWAQNAASGPSRDLDYHAEVVHHFVALHAAGIATDVIGPDADLRQYDLIVLAVGYLVRPDQGRAIAERVRAGATLVATFFSGVVDEHDHVHEGGAPGPLREVLGITVEEFDAIPASIKQGVRFPSPLGSLANVTLDATSMCERLWLQGAQPLAHYTNDFYAGDAAITVHGYGEGKAYYLGTRLDEATLGALFIEIAAERGIASPLRGGVAPPAGVETPVRVSPSGDALLYLLNHGNAEHAVELPEGVFRDALSGKVFEGTVTLAPRDVLILSATS
jgi:beta-galactosidase